MDRTYPTRQPTEKKRKSTILCKMCDRGRKLTVLSVSEIASTSTDACTFDAMLLCVSITPFGAPVVPDVYSTVATSCGSMASAFSRHSVASVSAAALAPPATKSSHPTTPSDVGTSNPTISMSWLAPATASFAFSTSSALDAKTSFAPEFSRM
jgi:hypothetical protein